MPRLLVRWVVIVVGLVLAGVIFARQAGWLSEGPAI